MEVLAAIVTLGMSLAPHAVIAQLASDLNSNLPINIILITHLLMAHNWMIYKRKQQRKIRDYLLLQQHMLFVIN
ncbi:MAG: hypothetical protein HRU04_13265 [Oceanospirillaceae bacterium]|nr:hypothetical protein [Oceanospirillaceae bacterium]